VTTAPAIDPKVMLRMIALAIVVGVVAAAGGSLFSEGIDLAQTALFESLPEAFGWTETPWWFAALLLLVGAGVVALARLLPGRTGGGPLTGFHFDDPLSMVPSVLLAAVGTLAFGMVLGPEAPLIVLGTAVGAILARRADAQTRKAAMLLGGVAAIGAIFGNPFVTGFMILEFMAVGLIPGMLLVPVLVALGAGYLTQVGVAGLPGFGSHSLSVPGLAAYPTIEPGDLLLGLLVAVVAAVVIVAAREGAVAVDRLAQRRSTVVLFGAAVVTALVLLVAQVGFDVPLDQILFSGNAGMAGLVQETSLAAVLVIVVGKSVAYAVALGGGFRGGPIFPATYIGVAVAVLVSLLLTDVSLTPLAAAGIAAAAAGMLKLPATSALLATLLVAGGGAGVAPFAIFGAVIGLLVRVLADRILGVPAAPVGSTPGHPEPSSA
jgi:H+/Cl- antiporter ClcA